MKCFPFRKGTATTIVKYVSKLFNPFWDFSVAENIKANQVKPQS